VIAADAINAPSRKSAHDDRDLSNALAGGNDLATPAPEEKPDLSSVGG
jgi:hypothetical protein